MTQNMSATDQHPQISVNKCPQSAPEENLYPHLDDLLNPVQNWCRSAGILFHQDPLTPGQWVSVLHGFLQASIAQFGTGSPHWLAPCWELQLQAHGALPAIREHPNATPPAGAAAVLLPCSTDALQTRFVLSLLRNRVRDCWLLEDDGWVIVPVETLLAEKILKGKIKPLLKKIAPRFSWNPARAAETMGTKLRFWRRTTPGSLPDSVNETGNNPSISSAAPVHLPAPRRGSQLWRTFIEADNRERDENPSRIKHPRKVVQYIGSLNSGGAERQLCNTAIGLKQRNYVCRVLTIYPSSGNDGQGHYCPLLRDGGIELKTVSDRPMSLETMAEIRWDLLAAAPASIRPNITQLAIELVENPTDVLHCWLDHPNIMGALAGMIAGVPSIILSTRNSNPTNFPRLHAPYMDEWYPLIAQSKRVHWIANSHCGAESYAKYLSIPVERFHIVLNGVFSGHFQTVTDSQQESARKKLGVPVNSPVVAVINRLSEEKQPFLMLKVIRLLLADLPDLRVLVAGVGPLEDQLRKTIRKRRLEKNITLLGRIENVNELLKASNALLLTSTLEGCPNVALEAQHVGIPVVATRGGGTVDAVVDGTTGFLCEVDDAVALTLSLRRILTDKNLARDFGANGRIFVDQYFDVDRMVDLTCKVYQVASSPNPDVTRIVTPKPCCAENGESSSARRSSPTTNDRTAGDAQKRSKKPTFAADICVKSPQPAQRKSS